MTEVDNLHETTTTTRGSPGQESMLTAAIQRSAGRASARDPIGRVRGTSIGKYASCTVARVCASLRALAVI